jgi:hypothetical protein
MFSMKRSDNFHYDERPVLRNPNHFLLQPNYTETILHAAGPIFSYMSDMLATVQSFIHTASIKKCQLQRIVTVFVHSIAERQNYALNSTSSIWCARS